ncbi:MAG: hypothetical protein C4527_24545 [Candidatus Omnitrophota bacterium]|jgi:hypothetical protein|nr:MAG: hypothetical protein C4527_24545 [Candidatus Omnitrophota bacterium]
MKKLFEEKSKRRRGRPAGSTNYNNWKPFEVTVSTLSESEKKAIIDDAWKLGLLYERNYDDI